MAADQENLVKKLDASGQLTMSGPATYRIIVKGELGLDMGSRLAGMSISRRLSDDSETESILVGRLPDQAALSSVLNALYDLQLPVISADCLESG
jgi:hypothetical protein